MLLAATEYAAFIELMLDYKFDMHAMGREITPETIMTSDLASPHEADEHT